MSTVSERTTLLALITTNLAALGIKTAEHYKGQIGDLPKLQNQVPAIYVYYDGTKRIEQGITSHTKKEYRFELLIVTHHADPQQREDDAVTILDTLETLIMNNEYSIGDDDTLLNSKNFYVIRLKLHKTDFKVL